jgi:hypothetical protein
MAIVLPEHLLKGKSTYGGPRTTTYGTFLTLKVSKRRSAKGSLLPFAAPSTKVRNGPLVPHLVEGRTATLSALLPFVAGAANDWIEPLAAFTADRSNGRFVPEGDIRDARHIRPQPGGYEAWQASVTLAWG